MDRAWLISLLFIALTGPMARGDSGPDVKEMEGTWKPQVAEFAGKPYPQKVLDTMKLVMKGETYLVEVAGKPDEGRTKLDPAKTPKAIDITGTRGPNKGKTFLAIYELKGDELEVCYDLGGKSRPTEFATRPDTVLFLVHYRRVKP